MDNQSQMKRRNKYTWTICRLALSVVLLYSACERRPLDEDELPRAASINVKIDWSKSGLNPLATYSGDDGVHRVSLRFFPKDGKPAFDLYLEDNVSEGKILVDVGEYSVVVFNESVSDINYWADAITFSDVNSYSAFAANIVPLSDAQRQQRFPHYKPAADEKFIAEPLRLASWSLDNFKVTEGMVLASYGQQPVSFLPTEEREMLAALEKIVMRALTHQINLTARVENLVSMSAGYAAMQGLASKVYMASGLTVQAPATYMFMFTGRQYNADSKNGTTGNSFLSFGRVPASSSYREAYFISADILLVNGEMYKPDKPLLFDVTGQMKSNSNTNINISLNIEFKLPLVEGNISVDDWGDDEVFTLE